MLLDRYLYYVQERQWDEETENPDSFDIEAYKKVFADKSPSLEPLEKIRHALQPSMYNIYIKNSLGDYKGRPDSLNSKSIRNVGLEDFEKDKSRIKKLQNIGKKHLYPDLEDDDAPEFYDWEDDGDGDGGDGGGGE